MIYHGKNKSLDDRDYKTLRTSEPYRLIQHKTNNNFAIVELDESKILYMFHNAQVIKQWFERVQAEQQRILIDGTKQTSPIGTIEYFDNDSPHKVYHGEKFTIVKALTKDEAALKVLEADPRIKVIKKVEKL